jgi:DNA-binding GntR family transcriptional regulator
MTVLAPAPVSAGRRPPVDIDKGRNLTAKSSSSSDDDEKKPEDDTERRKQAGRAEGPKRSDERRKGSEDRSWVERSGGQRGRGTGVRRRGRRAPEPALLFKTNEEGATGAVDRFGWEVTSRGEKSEKELAAQLQESEKERRLERKWIKMMGPEVPVANQDDRTLREYRTVHRGRFLHRVKQGIPDSCRSRAWQLILDPKSEDSRQRADSRYYFQRRVPWCDAAIQNDIPKTMPHIAMFTKNSVRESLYHVLRAYANCDRALGYAEGMSMIAAVLLTYMNEDRAFWSYYHLMRGNKIKFRNFFADDYLQLRTITEVWEKLLKDCFEKVYNNIKKHDIEHITYTRNWFLSAFLAVKFQSNFRLRILDRFFTFGTQALFSLAVTIVVLAKDELEVADSERVLAILQNPRVHPAFNDWRKVLARYDKEWLTTDDYVRWFRRARATFVP